MEVLFTFLAVRYERRSVRISSNLVFSQWDRFFEDPMTTAAAIDRLVHHAVILELTGGSIRNEVAQERAANSDSSERPADWAGVLPPGRRSSPRLGSTTLWSDPRTPDP